jgi:lipoprotein-anchoring transpeptidase ErfK/SrfK
MIIRTKLGPAAVAAVSLVAFMAAQGTPASAQLFWDWDVDNTVGGSGRQVISFSPQYGPGQIIVSFGDRKLYLITQPGQAISYPIAVPREKSRWEGVTSVTDKRVSPSWTPTPTMIAENPRLPRWVPGGHPYNPLGVRALYLGSSAYRIHGTDAPWTIGTAASKGCIRLFNQDVLDLYPRVNVGTKVTVTYQTFTTSGAPAPAISSLSTGNSKGLGPFLFGDDEPPVPSRPMRARTKGSASSKSTSSRHSKPDAEKPTPAEKPAAPEKDASGTVIETASSPVAHGQQQ